MVLIYNKIEIYGTDENSSSVVDKNNKDTRIYTLTDDKENNFLMEYYIENDLMNSQLFYRAIDTKDKIITIQDIFRFEKKKIKTL